VEPVEIEERVVLLQIPHLYREAMSDVALYEATRGFWRMRPDSHDAEFAFAIAHGIIREVYTVDRWQPAGTDTYRTRSWAAADRGRWEFVGRVADAEVRARYKGRTISGELRGQNPVRYVNC
jgi:uncharacterized protein